MKTGVLGLVLMASVPQVAAAQWTALSLPGGDHVQVFLPAPDALYVGTYLGNVFRTTDLGETWTEVGGGLDHATPVDALALVEDWLIAARSSWGGTHRCQLVAGACAAWQAVPDPGGSFGELAVVGSLAFGVLGGGLAVSADHGWTWSPVPLPGGGAARDVFSVGGTLFAVAESSGTGTGQLFRSADAGSTWDPVTGIGADLDVVASASYAGRIYCSSYTGWPNSALYRSEDDGVSWSLVASVPNPYPTTGLVPAGGCLAVGFSGEDGAGDTLYLTTDLATWNPYTGDLPPVARTVGRMAAWGGHLFKTGGTVTTYRAPIPAAPSDLFSDGFESGDTSAWSLAVP